MAEGLGLSGSKSLLNITAATVIDDTTVSSYAPRRIGHVHVLVAGSTTGTVNDCLTTAAAAAANLIFTIPNTVGVYVVDFPCLQGIVIVPGTGQTVAVSYD